MEFQKIVNLIDTTSDNKDLPTFVTEKWIEAYDQSEGNDNINKEMRIKTVNEITEDGNENVKLFSLTHHSK